eukprot:c27283_g1_i1 orf=552-1661(+)
MASPFTFLPHKDDLWNSVKPSEDQNWDLAALKLAFVEQMRVKDHTGSRDETRQATVNTKPVREKLKQKVEHSEGEDMDRRPTNEDWKSGQTWHTSSVVNRVMNIKVNANSQWTDSVGKRNVNSNLASQSPHAVEKRNGNTTPRSANGVDKRNGNATPRSANGVEKRNGNGNGNATSPSTTAVNKKGGNGNTTPQSTNVVEKRNGNGNVSSQSASAVDKRFKSLPAAETLPRDETLGGYIFVCNNDTMQEDLKRQLFGLPQRYRDSVRAIQPGLPLFLYNYTTHQLHGIFEAVSFGGSNIDPTAWEDKKSKGESRFPAQVRIRVRRLCKPLEEDCFRPFLHHYDGPKFRLQLSVPETLSLLDLFNESNSL